MTHQRGKRGKQSQLKWKMRQNLLANSRYDDEMAELVAVKSFDYVVEVVEKKYPFRVFSFLEPAEKGLVLADSRGRGAFNK